MTNDKGIYDVFLQYRAADSSGEVLKGIRCYFDKALPMMLLYKKERKQCNEAVVDSVSPSSIYGAEHLLRLFGMFLTFSAFKRVLGRRIPYAGTCTFIVLGNTFVILVSFVGSFDLIMRHWLY